MISFLRINQVSSRCNPRELSAYRCCGRYHVRRASSGKHWRPAGICLLPWRGSDLKSTVIVTTWIGSNEFGSHTTQNAKFLISHGSFLSGMLEVPTADFYPNFSTRFTHYWWAINWEKIIEAHFWYAGISMLFAANFMTSHKFKNEFGNYTALGKYTDIS